MEGELTFILVRAPQLAVCQSWACRTSGGTTKSWLWWARVWGWSTGAGTIWRQTRICTNPERSTSPSPASSLTSRLLLLPRASDPAGGMKVCSTCSLTSNPRTSVPCPDDDHAPFYVKTKAPVSNKKKIVAPCQQWKHFLYFLREWKWSTVGPDQSVVQQTQVSSWCYWGN